MKKKIDSFSIEEITNFKDRIQYYNDNEYRFQNELAKIIKNINELKILQKHINRILNKNSVNIENKTFVFNNPFNFLNYENPFRKINETFGGMNELVNKIQDMFSFKEEFRECLLNLEEDEENKTITEAKEMHNAPYNSNSYSRPLKNTKELLLSEEKERRIEEVLYTDRVFDYFGRAIAKKIRKAAKNRSIL